MISREKMDACLGRLGMLKRFPVQGRVQVQIGMLLNELCASDEEAEQFVSRVLDEHDEWPGPSVLHEIHGQLAARLGAQGRPQGCENCRDRGGWRPLFKIVERGTRNEEVIYPEGDTYAVMKQADEFFKKYRGSKTHLFYRDIITPCSCPAGQHVAAEQRRRREQEERRGRR